MSPKQTAIAIASIAGLIAVAVIAHVAIHKHFEHRRLPAGAAWNQTQHLPPPNTFGRLPSRLAWATNGIQQSGEIVPSPSTGDAGCDSLCLIDRKSQLFADESIEYEAGGTGHATESPPEPLLAPNDAAPIDTDKPQSNRGDDSGRPSRIESQEMDADELEIWMAELDGLPPHVVQDILRLRQSIGSPGSLSLDEAPPVASRTPVPQPWDDPADIPPHSYAMDDPLEEYSWSSAIDSSLVALRLARDVVLNNIANANTVGYKRQRVVFGDLPYQYVRRPGQQRGQSSSGSPGIAAGMGVEVAATVGDHSMGRLRRTGVPLDVAIVGDGFFQVQSGAEVCYTRAGQLGRGRDGELLVLTAGESMPVEPKITLPDDAVRVEIERDGTVSVLQAGETSPTAVGQLQLARFGNPAGLELRGGNLYSETGASGPAHSGSPGEGGLGHIRQGCLEESNVDLSDELRLLRRLQGHIGCLHRAADIVSGRENGTLTEASDR